MKYRVNNTELKKFFEFLTRNICGDCLHILTTNEQACRRTFFTDLLLLDFV